MLSVIIDAAARQEIDQAIAWYVEADPQVRLRLEEAISAAVQRIRHRPHLYRLAHDDLRVCNLKRFPYKIVFRPEATAIRIVAFFHTRRDPAIWQSRK